MEHFTTKCNVFNNGVTILNNRSVSITVKHDPKTEINEWDGALYLAGNESIIFFTAMDKTFGIELMDGRRGKFNTTQAGKTVFIKGSGPLG